MWPKSTWLLQSEELIMLNFSTQINGLLYVELCHVIFYILEEKEMLT